MTFRPVVILPLLVFAGLVVVFAVMLDSERNPQEIKSVLIGKPAPLAALPPLYTGKPPLDRADLMGRGPVLVNFFASWCVPCRAEHAQLMALARDYQIPIVGIAYKDTPDNARAFLQELGNPFTRTVQDQDGRMAIEWGVTGVPETFLVDHDGIIRYRHFGPIVGDSLEKRLLPQIEKVR